MFFNGRNAEKIASKVGAKLTKELALNERLAPYFGDETSDGLFDVKVDLPGPLPVTVSAQVIKNGLFGSMVGKIRYVAHLAKPIKAPVRLEYQGLLKGSRFEGDPEAAQRLNADAQLRLKSVQISRQEAVVGTVRLSIDPRFEVVPSNDGSVLLVDTLMDAGWFGAKFAAREFITLAETFEQTL